LDIELRTYNGPKAADRPGARHEPHTLLVEHHPLAASSVPGRLDPANARYVLNLLDRATDGATAGEFPRSSPHPFTRA